MSFPLLKLDWVGHDAAKFACEHWHYSNCSPSGRNDNIGVWENDEYKGAIIYGHSIGPYIGKQFGLDNFSCYELRRIALKSHITPVSRLISISLKLIVKKYPDAKLIISYADPERDHIGAIYQASNWVYIGTSSSMVQYLINGKYRNDKNAYSDQKHLAQGSRKTLPKYKYLYPLTEDMRAKIEPLRKPYPKKTDKSALVVHSVSTPVIHTGEEGSIPISTHEV